MTGLSNRPIFAAATLLLALGTATLAGDKKQSLVQEYAIPEPDQDNSMIIEFANAIEGTDGTPDSIGAKVAKAQLNKPGRTPNSVKPVSLGNKKN